MNANKVNKSIYFNYRKTKAFEKSEPKVGEIGKVTNNMQTPTKDITLSESHHHIFQNAAAAAAAASAASPTSVVPPQLSASAHPAVTSTASTSSGISSMDFLRRLSSAAQASSDDGGAGTPSTTGTGSGSHSAFSAVLRQHSRLSDSQDSQGFECGRLPPSSGSIGAKSIESRLSDDNTSATVRLGTQSEGRPL